MHYVISASPNADGLTAACAEAAARGIEGAGGSAARLDLCALKIKGCMVCGNGWGTCRESHACCIEDGLREMQIDLSECEGLFLVTPVYWGMPSERMKSFMDRFRRCEAIRGEEGALAGKRVNLVAAAGGSGNGTVTCLADMENWCRHLRAIPHHRLGVTRFNREGLLSAIEAAGAESASANR